MLGEVLSADPGYRGPRADCGNGHEGVFTGYRDKVIDTVLGPVTLRRAWYHCARCERGLAPRDAELGVAGQSMSPGLAAMTARAAAAEPFTRSAGIVIDRTGVPVTAKETAGREGKGEDGRARIREVKMAVLFTQDRLDAERPPGPGQGNL